MGGGGGGESKALYCHPYVYAYDHRDTYMGKDCAVVSEKTTRVATNFGSSALASDGLQRVDYIACSLWISDSSDSFVYLHRRFRWDVRWIASYMYWVCI